MQALVRALAGAYRRARGETFGLRHGKTARSQGWGHARPKSLPLARGDAGEAGRDEEQAPRSAEQRTQEWIPQTSPAGAVMRGAFQMRQPLVLGEHFSVRQHGTHPDCRRTIGRSEAATVAAILATKLLLMAPVE